MCREALLGELVAVEDVYVRIGDIVDSGKTVEMFAVAAFIAEASSEEKAEGRAGNLVGFGIPAVLGDIDAARRGVLGVVIAVSTCAAPRLVYMQASAEVLVVDVQLVIPDVVYHATLRRLFRIESFRVDLRASWTPFNLFDRLRHRFLGHGHGIFCGRHVAREYGRSCGGS